LAFLAFLAFFAFFAFFAARVPWRRVGGCRRPDTAYFGGDQPSRASVQPRKLATPRKHATVGDRVRALLGVATPGGCRRVAIGTIPALLGREDVLSSVRSAGQCEPCG